MVYSFSNRRRLKRTSTTGVPPISKPTEGKGDDERPEPIIEIGIYETTPKR